MGCSAPQAPAHVRSANDHWGYYRGYSAIANFTKSISNNRLSDRLRVLQAHHLKQMSPLQLPSGKWGFSGRSGSGCGPSIREWQSMDALCSEHRVSDAGMSLHVPPRLSCRCQRRVHDFMIVKYAEVVGWLTVERTSKALLNFGAVLLSHDKDHVGPSINSPISGLSVPWFVPADATSKSCRCANTRSAVGLRRRFWLQTNRTFFKEALLQAGRLRKSCWAMGFTANRRQRR